MPDNPVRFLPVHARDHKFIAIAFSNGLLVQRRRALYENSAAPADRWRCSGQAIAIYARHLANTFALATSSPSANSLLFLSRLFRPSRNRLFLVLAFRATGAPLRAAAHNISYSVARLVRVPALFLSLRVVCVSMPYRSSSACSTATRSGHPSDASPSPPRIRYISAPRSYARRNLRMNVTV
ncbi:hypothetical protein MSAN_01343800 [Mycena sanguinolenta]|uniref:Uncharacterized protein n=1 Tax=Mycena sanguinolenta TaxID=230812 RepID=A0A8H7D3C6_9AGAR|nr:hypothetical protein MSAN_01343800 [Mycena sanguinolenta]